MDKPTQDKFDRDQRLMRKLSAGLTSSGGVKADSTNPGASSTSGVTPTAHAPSASGDTNALYKELSTKLAWSVGSTFGLAYTRRSRIMGWALKQASALVARYCQLSNSEKAGL